jgi:hypothetical protein
MFSCFKSLLLNVGSLSKEKNPKIFDGAFVSSSPGLANRFYFNS